jgi:diguanylate cyclase (GGDEF)-like protein/PAS domain S-box-containing protein
MKYRIALALLGLTALALVAGLWWGSPALIKQIRLPCYNEEQTIASLLTAAGQFALRHREYELLQRTVDEIARSPVVLRAMVTDKNQLVIAKSWQTDPSETTVRLPNAPNSHWRTWGIGDAAGHLGSVTAQFSECDWPQTGAMLTNFAVIFGAGLVLLGLLVVWTTNSRLDLRLQQLRKAADTAAHGDFAIRAEARGTDEMGKFGRAFNRMLQSLQKSTDTLRASEERFNLAVTGANDAIWDWNLANNALYLSPRFADILGFEPDALPALYNAWIRLLHPDDTERVKEEIQEHLQDQVPFQSEFRVQAKDGTWRWLLGRGQAVRDRRGHPIRMVGSYTDITERKQAEEALFREKERAQVTLQSIGDGVITTDMNGRVEYLNPAAEELTGWVSGRAKAQPIDTVFTAVHEQSGKPLPNPVAQVLSTAQILRRVENTILRDREGEQYYIEYSASPIKSHRGAIVGVVLVFRNTTEHRRLLQRLSYQASHDALTNLINRYAFEKRVQYAIDAANDYEAQNVLCYLDLDQFKIVNDTSGHAAGDELLRQLAIILHAQFRRQDTLARLGGDEFGLLLENCPMDKAIELLEKTRQAVKSFRFVWEDKTFSVGVSIGVVEIVGSESSPADLLSIVDQACYIAKSKGRDQIHVFQPDDLESSRWRGDVQWAGRLQEALDEERFVLFGQPIVPLSEDGKDYRHYEVLLRMKEKDGKIVPPGAFLPAAERYGMMRLVDRWVIQAALEAITTAWPDKQAIPIDTFAINLSGGMLGDKNFLDFITLVLKDYAIPPQILCFEITETVAIANFGTAQTFMHHLKDLGCRFSLDDFGSGFASFSYLKTLPVDYLKIDGAFVRHMDTQPLDYAMVEVINRIGQVMNLKTIAEFVENQAIVDHLKELNVDFAQGYHFAKPKPLYEICYGRDDEEDRPPPQA